MSDPSYHVVDAIYRRLIATPEVLALVPEANIVDRSSGLPTVFPCILIGEAQSVDEGQSVARKVLRVFATLHLWTEAQDVTSVKHVGGAVWTAIGAGRLVLGGGLHCADVRIDGARYLRDPSGKHGHGIVTVNTLVGVP